MKRLIAGCIALLFVFFTACGGSENNTQQESGETPADYGTLRVHTMAIGKADCIFIKTENHLMAIDLGNKSDADEIVEYAQSLTDTADVLLITHYDKDHIGAAKKFLNKMKVTTVYLPEYEDEKEENAATVKEYLNKHSITPVTVTKQIDFTFDGVSFTVYPTDILFKRNDNGSNASSLVVKVKHGNNVFLFTGDAEQKRLPEIVEQLGSDARVDFLKVPHHGVYDDNSEAFFKAVCAQYAVITCSAAEPADGSVVKLLKDLGTEVFFTSDGAVDAVSDGTSITVTAAKS